MATTSASGTEFSADVSAVLAEGEELPPGIGPWRLAWRRLRRNKTALFFGGVFIVIVILCLLAPVYAKHVAHTTLAAQKHRQTDRHRGQKDVHHQPDGDPDRADVAQQVLPRSRRERP